MSSITRARWLGLLLVSVVVFVGAGRQADVLGFVVGKDSTVSIPVNFSPLYATGDFEGEAMVLPGLSSQVVGMLTQVYVPTDFVFSPRGNEGLSVPEGTDPQSITRESLRGIYYFHKASAAGQVYARFSPDRGRAGSVCTMVLVSANGRVTVLADATFAIREQRMGTSTVVVPVPPVYAPTRNARQPDQEDPSNSKELKRKIVHDVIGMALQKLAR